MVARWRGAFALGVAIALAGCGPDTREDGSAPSEAAPMEKSVRHGGLRAVESRIQEALQTIGAPAPGEPAAAPEFATVFEGASQLARGADDVLADQPEGLGEAERLQYEGLVAQLRQKAADLQAAAEHQQANQARRSFAQATASCVRCHDMFWKQ